MLDSWNLAFLRHRHLCQRSFLYHQWRQVLLEIHCLLCPVLILDFFSIYQNEVKGILITTLHTLLKCGTGSLSSGSLSRKSTKGCSSSLCERTKLRPYQTLCPRYPSLVSQKALFPEHLRPRQNGPWPIKALLITPFLFQSGGSPLI